MSQSRVRIRKLPVYDHVTHMVYIHILIGHEELDNLYFILRIFFFIANYRKIMHFLKTCTVNVMGKVLTGQLYCTWTGRFDCPNWVRQHSSGPSCLKLMMSLVNVLLKFQTLISNIR